MRVAKFIIDEKHVLRVANLLVKAPTFAHAIELSHLCLDPKSLSIHLLPDGYITVAGVEKSKTGISCMAYLLELKFGTIQKSCSFPLKIAEETYLQVNTQVSSVDSDLFVTVIETSTSSQTKAQTFSLPVVCPAITLKSIFGRNSLKKLARDNQRSTTTLVSLIQSLESEASKVTSQELDAEYLQSSNSTTGLGLSQEDIFLLFSKCGQAFKQRWPTKLIHHLLSSGLVSSSTNVVSLAIEMNDMNSILLAVDYVQDLSVGDWLSIFSHVLSAIDTGAFEEWLCKSERWFTTAYQSIFPSVEKTKLSTGKAYILFKAFSGASEDAVVSAAIAGLQSDDVEVLVAWSSFIIFYRLMSEKLTTLELNRELNEMLNNINEGV